jgi:hypothetical protein
LLVTVTGHHLTAVQPAALHRTTLLMVTSRTLLLTHAPPAIIAIAPTTAVVKGEPSNEEAEY